MNSLLPSMTRTVYWKLTAGALRHDVWAAVAILLFAVLLRSYGISDEKMWFDEVYAATFSMQSLFDCLVVTLRFDSHPPLYYLQLNIWALISHSLEWLYMNSVFWSAATVAVLFLSLRTLGYPRLAIIAALLLAAMPAGSEMAHYLRMYPLCTFLVVPVWYYSEKFVTAPNVARNGAMVSLFLLLSAYSYMAGALVFIYAAAYTLCRLIQTGAFRARLRPWIVFNLCATILALPAVAIAAVRSITHTSAPGLTDVLTTMSGLVAGPTGGPLFWAVAVAGLGLALIGLVFSPDPRLRATIFAFVIVPPLLAVVVSYAIRPIWVDRSMYLTIPFLALAIAEGIAVAARTMTGRFRATGALASVGAGIVAAGLTAATVAGARLDTKPTDFRAAAAMIRAGLQPGDAIYIPDNIVFWGIAWYLVGPEWGSPLRIQDASPENYTDRWNSVLTWLGPAWRTRLHLEPTEREIDYKNTPMIVGWSKSPAVSQARRVWLVNHLTYTHGFMVLDGYSEIKKSNFKGLLVQLLTPTGH